MVRDDLIPPSYPVSHYPPDPSFTRAGAWLSTSRPGDAADAVLMGVPLAKASISGARCDLLPAAVRAAMWKLSTYGMGAELSELSVLDVGDVRCEGADVEQDLQTIEKVSADLPDVPLLAIGGDNSITSAVMLGRIGPGGSMLTIDAHHDLRDYRRDGITNGSVVRVLNDRGVSGDRIWQVGIRDFANSREYSEYATSIGITVVKAEAARRHGLATYVRRALAELSASDGIYVDIDVDAVERALAPGAPAALPGGFAPADLIDAAFMVGAHPKVVACDIVEVDPERDVAESTVRLAAMIALAFFAGVATRLRT